MARHLRRLFEGDGLRALLLRGGVGSMAVKIASVGLAFGVSVALARLLGPAGYGVYSFALAVLTIVALPVQVGLPQLVVRETAKAQADADWPLMRGLWRWASLVVLALSAVCLAGLGVAYLLLDSSPRLETLVVGAVLVPFIALGNLRSASLRGLRMVVFGQLPESIIRPLALLLVLLVLAAAGTFGPIGTPQKVMGWYVLAAVVSFFLGAVLLYRFSPAEVRQTRTSRQMPREWIGAMIPLALIAGLQLINNQADIITIGIFRSDEEVGIYKVVYQIGLLVIFGLQAMNLVLQPHFARLYRQGDMKRLQRLVTLSARIILLLALPPVIVFVLFGAPILGFVFGEAYREGSLALAILAAGQLVNAAMGSVGFLLNMTGHERDTLVSVLVSASVNILLNFVLVPSYGMTGAAIATAVSLVIWNVMMRFAVISRINIEPSAFGR
ncbi:MAG: flippase [Parvibaculum sp.]|nr:flippase [Parvibaculum sp.]